MAPAALDVAISGRPAVPPVEWGRITDLARAIKAKRGNTPYAQALVLRWLLEHGAGEGAIHVPPAAAIARDVGIARQSGNRAWAALVRRGLIVAKPLAGDQGWYRVTLKFPKGFQQSLFRTSGPNK